MLGKVVEECDESLGWLEMLIENGFGPAQDTKALATEADELVRIFVKSRKTAERNHETDLACERAGRPGKPRITRA